MPKKYDPPLVSLGQAAKHFMHIDVGVDEIPFLNLGKKQTLLMMPNGIRRLMLTTGISQEGIIREVNKMAADMGLMQYRYLRTPKGQEPEERLWTANTSTLSLYIHGKRQNQNMTFHALLYAMLYNQFGMREDDYWNFVIVNRR